jgi:hypothetical protein
MIGPIIEMRQASVEDTRTAENGRLYGQVYGGILVLSRGDIERITAKESPGIGPGFFFTLSPLQRDQD